MDTCGAAVTTLTATSFTGVTISEMAISPGQLQQATQQAVAQAAQQWHEAAAQIARHRNLTSPGAGCGSSGTTTARGDHQPGGYATARKARIFRRRQRLEGLERCLQKLCVCLLCAAGLTLERYGEIRRTDAQRDADAVRSIVLDKAVPSSERWSTGGPEGIAMLGPASRTDLIDTQHGFVAARQRLEWHSSTATSTATRKQAARRSQRTSISALLFACCQTDR